MVSIFKRMIKIHVFFFSFFRCENNTQYLNYAIFLCAFYCDVANEKHIVVCVRLTVHCTVYVNRSFALWTHVSSTQQYFNDKIVEFRTINVLVTEIEKKKNYTALVLLSRLCINRHMYIQCVRIIFDFQQPTHIN